MTTDPAEKQWDLGADHNNLMVLLDYLAECGATSQELLHAAEKPWHYNDELIDALASFEDDDDDTAEDFSPDAGHHEPAEEGEGD